MSITIFIFVTAKGPRKRATQVRGRLPAPFAIAPASSERPSDSQPDCHLRKRPDDTESKLQWHWLRKPRQLPALFQYRPFPQSLCRSAVVSSWDFTQSLPYAQLELRSPRCKHQFRSRLADSDHPNHGGHRLCDPVLIWRQNGMRKTAAQLRDEASFPAAQQYRANAFRRFGYQHHPQ